MADTASLALPLLAAAQAQKHITHNEALILLDAVAQIAVRAVGQNAPPANPVAGDRIWWDRRRRAPLPGRRQRSRPMTAPHGGS